MNQFAEQLKAWTKEFALRVINMVGALPKSTAGRVLGDQVLRSGTSIGANYREAYRARSRAEFKAKIGDSLKEADETQYWLELISGAKLLAPKRLQPLQDECSELIALFASIRARTD